MVSISFAIKKLIREKIFRKEGFVEKSISLNALKRKSSRKLSEVWTETTRRLGSLCDKSQGFSNEEACKEALKFKFTINILSE